MRGQMGTIQTSALIRLARIPGDLRRLAVTQVKDDGVKNSQKGKNYYIIIIIYSLRVFHISVSWWSFTRVWVTASLLKSSWLFLVFWPFSTMLWSPLVLQHPRPTVPFNSPLVAIPNAPITIYYYCNLLIRVFHISVSLQDSSQYYGHFQ